MWTKRQRAKEVVGDKEKDAEVEEGEEVNQFEDPILAIAPPAHIPAVEPILMLSLASKATNNLIFPVVAPTAEDLIEHSFNKGGSLCSNSNEEYMVPKHRVLAQRRFSQMPHHPNGLARGRRSSPRKGLPAKTKGGGLVELGKQVTNADTSRDHETCLALGNVIMLPQDLADLAAEDSEEFKERMIMQGVLPAEDQVANADAAQGNKLGGGEVQGVVGDEREGVDKGNPPKE
ncbi:hypothetical protein Acr_00g0056310 [Actinidia rufa]|uniref:Uncharacterized protein n=1 Tax=Actinidia rufa TaxID=165716 RepID=A0A7J0DM56_9ERIC|nr:hypothetical protein Acr_00g0056310 [Actinidia rufa]